MLTFFIILSIILMGTSIWLAVLFARAVDARKNLEAANRTLLGECDTLGSMYENMATKFMASSQIIGDMTQEALTEAKAAKETAFEQALANCENPDLVLDLYGFCDCGEEYFKDRFRPQHICRACGEDLEQAA